MDYTEKVVLLERAYCCFNERRIDDLLAMMTDDVQWPDVAHGTVLDGKALISPYWEAQFAVSDPTVIPTDFFPVGRDLVAVIKQRILNHRGELLTPPSTLFHRYTFRDDRVSRMVVFVDREAAAMP
ncbi:MAG: nuclear transport factor 2 family protein [Acidimicrobiales bacterium]